MISRHIGVEVEKTHYDMENKLLFGFEKCIRETTGKYLADQWRKEMYRFRKFSAWLPHALCRHVVTFEASTQQGMMDESQVFLDRLANFRPKSWWTLSHREDMLQFRFMNNDDAVMFKLLVT